MAAPGIGVLFLVFSALILVVSNGELVIRRPETGVGKLLISEDDAHADYNKERLMVFFDLDCINSNNNHNRNNDIKIHQESAVSTIINNHYPCLSHTRDHHANSKHFQFSSHNTAISFLDIDNRDGNCLDTPISSKTSLNYTQHCINMFTHEPTFKLASALTGIGGSMRSLSNFTDATDTCTTVATNNVTQWALDASDSSTLDNMYTYPEITFDNEVDLHIIDSGIRSTHEEFYSGQVVHIMGDGPSYYSARDLWAAHGTHVADVAGGILYGHSKNITIYDYRVCELVNNPNNSLDDTCYYSNIITALSEINDNLANSGRRGVINLSLVGYRSVFTYVFEYYFKLINKNGGISVVSAGNTDSDACDSILSYDSAITVGATDSSYTKASYSNWGDCVNYYAPGTSIYGATADSDDAYNSFDGTSFAAAAISGTIANLLWYDPTLSFHEIKTVLSSNSITLTGDRCDDDNDNCIYPIYNCSLLPAEYYDGSLEPTTSTLDPSELEYIVYSGVPEYDLCNYFAIAELNFDFDDSSNHNNYFVQSVLYGATDKCVATQESVSSKYSYAVECIDNITANVVVYDDNIDCSGDGTIVKTLISGQVNDDDWYLIDCDNKFDLENEEINVYDDSDCDVVTRWWNFGESDIITSSSDNADNCTWNQTSATFYDFAEIIGACNSYVNATTGFTYSYEYLCFPANDTASGALSRFWYYGDDCNLTYFIYSDYWEEGCFEESGFAMELLECGNVDLFYERTNYTYIYYYFDLDAEDVTAGTWILLWSSMSLALLCCVIAVFVVVVTFETFWQREKCHLPFRIPFISPHSSLSKSKLASMNDNIEPIFRILTTLIVCVYAGSLLVVTIGQCIQNSAIADYAANGWEYKKSIQDAYEAGGDMGSYSFYIWIYCKLPLYILFISRLWYVFNDTKYKYHIGVFVYFGVMLIVQTYLATHWLFLDSIVLHGFWDVVFLLYSTFDLVIIGSCVWLFVRRLTSLAVAQTVEKTLKTGEISVMGSQGSATSGQSGGSSRAGMVTDATQGNIQAVPEDEEQESVAGSTVTSPIASKRAKHTPGPSTGARAPGMSVVSVASVTKNAEMIKNIALNKRQLKLVFEITRYTLLTLIAMLSTFSLGFIICYLYYKQRQYPFDGCNLNCVINVYAIQSFVQGFDCFVNVIAIHLNTGFQRKNYEMICKVPHACLQGLFLKRTRNRIVAKANKKLNEGIELNAHISNSNPSQAEMNADQIEMQPQTGGYNETNDDTVIGTAADDSVTKNEKENGTRKLKGPKEKPAAVTDEWEFD